MPVHYSINSRHGYFVFICEGTTTDEEMFDARRALYEDGEYRPVLHELADLSQADHSEITSGGLQRLASFISENVTASNVSSSKTAIFAPTELPLAIAKMYQALSVGSPENVRVFGEMEAATRWLEGEHEIVGEISTDADGGKRPTDSNLSVLSKREGEVLNLIAAGSSNREIAEVLGVSPHTVKAHTANIYDKLEVTSRTKAVAKATSLGLLPTGR